MEIGSVYGSILGVLLRISGAIILVIAIGSSSTSAQSLGRFSAGCLTNDSVLKKRERLAPFDAAAVVTTSAGQLRPLNQKFSEMQIQMSLPAAVTLNSGIAASLTINSITDDQVSNADTGRLGCDSPRGSQDPDSKPVSGSSLFASGNLHAETDTVSISGVQLRRRRCSNSGAHTYQIKFTCCDITNGVCDSTPQMLSVLVPGAHISGLHHYEYVLRDANLYVYDMDDRFSLVKNLSLPTGAGVRGVVTSATASTLYVSYGSDNTSGGSLLAYDIRRDAVVWTRKYRFAIDSMSISPDGKKIYMPTGELTAGGMWEIIDASTGNVIGAIDSGGSGPHNTVVSRSGAYIFMGL